MLFGTEAVELEILKGIKRIFECEILDKAMPIFTRLGDGGFVWIFIAVAFLFTKKYRRSGVLVILGLLLGVVFGNLLLKNIIARPRPFECLQGTLLLIDAPKDWSFPSGHTLSSFTAASLIFKANKKFGILALILAFVIAFSRLYLFVHYPSDVLGAAILSALIVYCLVRFSLRKIC